MKKRLVDLFTFDEELFNSMSKSFEGEIDSSEKEETCYRFLDLEYSTLKEFLKGKNYTYELRDSKSGDFVYVGRKTKSGRKVSSN